MSWPDPLRLDLRNGAWRQQKQILLAFAVIIVGVAVALIPASYDERALGGLTGSGPDVNVPALCFLVGDLCLAMGVWAAAKAAQGKPFQRLFIAVLGIASAALAGQSSRRVLQIVLLRDFYRPSLFFTGTSCPFTGVETWGCQAAGGMAGCVAGGRPACPGRSFASGAAGMAGCMAGSQGLPARALVMASSAVRPWFAAESR